MTEIAVTVFDIHKVEAGFLRQFRCVDVISNELFDFIVAHHGIIIGQAEFAIEKWMGIKNLRFHLLFVGRTAETTRVSQLQADEQIIRAPAFGVSADQDFSRSLAMSGRLASLMMS